MLKLTRWFALTALFVGAWCSTAHATQVGAGRDFGLGFAVGSPMSLVGKAFVARDEAIDFGVGVYGVGGCWGRRDRDDGCRGYSNVTLNADYLWIFDIVKGRGAQLDWHIGAGGRVWLYDGGFDLSARMPVGLDLTFPKPDFLEVFLDIAPALTVIPGLWLGLEAQLGVRFYF